MDPLTSPHSSPNPTRRHPTALRSCWRLPRRKRQYLRLLVLLLTIGLTVVLGLDLTLQQRILTTHSNWPLRRTPPRISLIVVWTGTERLNHLTWFLDSVARQPNELELILIQRGDTFVDLESSIEPATRNIKLVRMSNAECECEAIALFPSTPAHPPLAPLPSRRLATSPRLPVQTMGRV
jgi:hypothetical protein